MLIFVTIIMIVKEAVRLTPKDFRKIFDKDIYKGFSGSSPKFRPDLSAATLDKLIPAEAVGRWLSNPDQARKIVKDIIRTYNVPRDYKWRKSRIDSTSVGNVPGITPRNVRNALADVGAGLDDVFEFTFRGPAMGGRLISPRFERNLVGIAGLDTVFRSNDAQLVPGAFKLRVPHTVGDLSVSDLFHELGHAAGAVSNQKQYLKDALAKAIIRERWPDVLNDPTVTPWRKLLLKREIFNNEVLANIAGGKLSQSRHLSGASRLPQAMRTYNKLRNLALDTYRYQGYGIRNLPTLGEGLKSLADPSNARHEYFQKVISAYARRTGKSVDESMQQATRIINKLVEKYLGPDGRVF